MNIETTPNALKVHEFLLSKDVYDFTSVHYGGILAAHNRCSC